MGRSTGSVVGLPQLKELMLSLPSKVAVKIVSAGIRAGATSLVKEARAMAPNRTGALRRAISVRRGKRDRKTRVTYYVGVETGKIPTIDENGRVKIRKRNGVLSSRKATRREKAGEDPFYYRWQELGFTAVGRRKGGSGPFIPGKLFLTKAINENESKTVDVVEREMRRRIAAFDPSK